MLVKDVMCKKVFTINPDKPLKEAIRIMCDNDIGCLIVTKNDKVMGIITERDVMRCVAKGTIGYAHEIKVSSVMTHYIYYVKPEDKIEKAIKIIRKHKIKKLPVLNNYEKLVGIITTTDIVLVEPKIIEKISELLSKNIKDI